jgi:hypothetical protein
MLKGNISSPLRTSNAALHSSTNATNSNQTDRQIQHTVDSRFNQQNAQKETDNKQKNQIDQYNRRQTEIGEVMSNFNDDLSRHSAEKTTF